MALLPFLPAITAFVLYASSAPPGLTWKHGGADGGELAAAAAVLGVAHPTGYPLWTVLAHLALALPLPGSPAFHLNLFSGTASAAALACLTAALITLLPEGASTRDRAVAATVPPLLLAVAPAWWQQSIITEVYALHFLLLGALVLAWARLRARPSVAQAAAVGGITGLALAHHVTASLVLPGLALALWLDRGRLKHLSWGAGVASGVAVLPGLALYGLLPLWAERQALMNWGDPRTLDNFIAHVTGAAYQSYLRDMPLAAAIGRIPVAARLILDQTGWPGFFLIIWGIWEWFHEPDGKAPAALVLAGSAGVLAHAVHYNARDSQVYLVPLYLFLTLALSRGLLALLAAVGQRVQQRRFPPWAPAVVLAALVLWPAGNAIQQWPDLNLRDDREPEQWTAAVLAELPERAVIVSHDDFSTFTLWYAQVVEGQRPDVLVLDYRLLAHPWYLANLRRLHPSMPWPEDILPMTAIPAFVQEVGNTGDVRPLFFTFQPAGIPTSQAGPLRRVS